VNPFTRSSNSSGAFWILEWSSIRLFSWLSSNYIIARGAFVVSGGFVKIGFLVGATEELDGFFYTNGASLRLAEMLRALKFFKL